MPRIVSHDSTAGQLDEFFVHPFLARVREELLRDFPDSIEFLDLCPNETLMQEGAHADRLYFISSGELSTYLGNQLSTLVRAPYAVGVLSLMDNGRRPATLIAFTRCLVVSVTYEAATELLASHPDMWTILAEYQAMELRTLYHAGAGLERNLADFFLSPNARIVPGPYYVDELEMILLLVSDRYYPAASLLPLGLMPMPFMNGVYLMTLCHYQDMATKDPAGQGRSFQYNEVGPLLPVVGRCLKPGFFSPELYPDNYLAILLGREIYGLPKRYGRTEHHQNEDRIDFMLDEEVLLRTQWNGETPLDSQAFGKSIASTLCDVIGLPEVAANALGYLYGVADQQQYRWLWPSVDVYAHKQIPDESSAYRTVYDVNQLVKIPFHITGIRSYAQLQRCELTFFQSDWLLAGECIDAYRIRMSFEFGAGSQVIDYKSCPWSLLTFLRRALTGR